MVRDEARAAKVRCDALAFIPIAVVQSTHTILRRARICYATGLIYGLLLTVTILGVVRRICRLQSVRRVHPRLRRP